MHGRDGSVGVGIWWVGECGGLVWWMGVYYFGMRSGTLSWEGGVGSGQGVGEQFGGFRWHPAALNFGLEAGCWLGQ